MTVTQPPSENRVIGSFTSQQWDGTSNPKPASVLSGLRGKRLWGAIIAFLIVANLGALGTVAIVLAAIGIVTAMIITSGRLSPQQALVNGLMADVNDTITGLSDAADGALSVKDLGALRDSGRHIPLPVNGVPGLSLCVVSDNPHGAHTAAVSPAGDTVRTTRVIVSAAAPDYGTAGFDRLVQATLDAD